MLEALWTGGGEHLIALWRARAAVVLNALNPRVGYPISCQTILTYGDAAQLDQWNNKECPLN